MPLRRAGSSNYYFIWRRQVQPSGNPQFLSQFKSDPSAMYDLRRELAESSPGVYPSSLTDDQVLAGIARLLSAGELLIAREELRQGGSGGQPISQQAPPPNAAPAPSSSPKAPPPESPTFASNTNAAAQAAVLVAAAASGAGFCPH
jgi:hypothetical protein